MSEKELLQCADMGDLEGVKRLLDQGVDPNFRDSAGFTALEYANNGYPHIPNKDHLGLVKALVQAGADVNAQAGNGQTPLFNAAADGHLDVVAYLIEQGADVNARLDTGANAFHDLARGIVNRPLNFTVTVQRNGKQVVLTDPDEIRREIGSHPDDEFKALLDTARLLLDNGLDITAEFHDRKQTALFDAAHLGAGEIVDMILATGKVDVNKGDVWGLRPLHYACRDNQLDTVGRLVRAGADVNVQDDIGFTPLHEAAENGHLDLARELIQYGADPLLGLKKAYKIHAAGARALDVAKKAGKRNVADYLAGL